MMSLLPPSDARWFVVAGVTRSRQQVVGLAERAKIVCRDTYRLLGGVRPRMCVLASMFTELATHLLKHDFVNDLLSQGAMHSP
jgi:hypothetical protein